MFDPKDDKYPFSRKEVLLGWRMKHRRIIIKAAECMKGPRPKNQHARRAACSETLVESFVPYAKEPELHRRILGAAGSYAKAMGWWSPASQAGG